jgi:WhiB family redox-sensing transcriptional regulator
VHIGRANALGEIATCVIRVERTNSHRCNYMAVDSAVSRSAVEAHVPGRQSRGRLPPVNDLMKLLAEDRSWQSRANCMGVDPDLFFPERGASTKEAKEVCRGCVVKDDCLEFALRNSEKFGIWGGMSERERRRVRRARALSARKAQAV